MTTFNVVWSDPVSSSQVASERETSMEAIGADGSTVYPGTTTGPGTWAIAGVPVGPYTLHVTWTNGLSLYFQSSADVFDLGGDGSPAVINPASFGTLASFSWTSLRPWDPATDQIQIYSYDALVWDLFDPWLPAGATSGGTDYDWGTYYQNLLEPNHTLYAAQMRSAPVGAAGDIASTAVASASLTGAYLVNGGLTYLPHDLLAPACDRDAPGPLERQRLRPGGPRRAPDLRLPAPGGVAAASKRGLTVPVPGVAWRDRAQRSSPGRSR